jgi:hypothetical protein
MKPEVALSLIEDGVDRTSVRQIWADLGAGNGVFTHALSTLLHDGSTLYAIDMNAARMESIRVWQQNCIEKNSGRFCRRRMENGTLERCFDGQLASLCEGQGSFLAKTSGKTDPGRHTPCH